MNGNPAQFEAIGARLGFSVAERTPERLRLLWRGPRFPAFLCLGIAMLLLLASVPIVQALHLRGFTGPAASLWYFPLMNLILFGIAIFLITQRRTIEIDGHAQTITLRRQSLYRSITLLASCNEIANLKLGVDHVQSGFALGGSTAAQTFAVPSLRLGFTNGGSVLLDRGSFRKLAELGNLVSERLAKPLDIDPQWQAPTQASAAANSGKAAV
ncbi:MAG TPA: hypothetical protein VH985_26370 [Candidatus Binatia bacterium]|jgi:hypothetical protein